MALNLTKPTGRPSWPVVLLDGGPGAGKSYAIAVASGSELVDGCIWVNFGEKRPDEYAEVPGANFAIAEHDGTYEGLLETLTEAVALGQGEKPRLLALDSATKLWESINVATQAKADAQATARADARGRVPVLPAEVTPELHVEARERWQRIVDTLQAHQGPVIVTARAEDASIVDDSGTIIVQKSRVLAQKSLGFEAGAIIDMPERGRAILRKIVSARKPMDAAEEWPDFTVDALWRRLGLHEGADARTYDRAVQSPQLSPTQARNWIAEVKACTDVASADRLIAEAESVRRPAETVAAMRGIRDGIAELADALG
ncbi:hypothetical protein QT381_02715 [Galbitalea sp. SE-J8]|uniref:hypothetical protein n=1 Tax=Galbitalea sp. SE-J8 TaxID=3054952 RepID=UPI00259D241D|nr:hypothetical protein [Galbitalea sp. SE-J8]MDM4761916.1 hypothetical protein [Galbitalea sp. SE-J8]